MRQRGDPILILVVVASLFPSFSPQSADPLYRGTNPISGSNLAHASSRAFAESGHVSPRPPPLFSYTLAFARLCTQSSISLRNNKKSSAAPRRLGRKRTDGGADTAATHRRAHSRAISCNSVQDGRSFSRHPEIFPQRERLS